jgi:TRAP-type mannitol/chloroaromatic compound transport system substrate-binding protein
MTWKAIDRYSQDYIVLQQTDKVKFYKTPNSVLTEQLVVWDKIIEKKSAENPMFKRVIESQRKFAERATKWQNDTNIDFKIAAQHYFAKKA